MAEPYFVSKPTSHLTRIAEQAGKSALDIQDTTAKQMLIHAAKQAQQKQQHDFKSGQQSQQHGFKMGQIDRTGLLTLANTLTDEGYTPPLTNMSNLQQYMTKIGSDMERKRLADRFRVIAEGVQRSTDAGLYPNIARDMTIFDIPGARIRQGTPVSVRASAAGNPALAKVEEGSKVWEERNIFGGKLTGAVKRKTEESRTEQTKLKGDNIDIVAHRLGINNLNEGQTKTISGITYRQGQYIPKAGGYLIILPDSKTILVDKNGKIISRSK